MSLTEAVEEGNGMVLSRIRQAATDDGCTELHCAVDQFDLSSVTMSQSDPNFDDVCSRESTKNGDGDPTSVRVCHEGVEAVVVFKFLLRRLASADELMALFLGHGGGDWRDRGASLRLYADARDSPTAIATYPCSRRQPPGNEEKG